MVYLVYIILICVILFFIRKFLSRYKFPKVGAIAVITGGVKSGKSAVSLALAYSNYRRVHSVWKWLECPLAKLLRRPKPEEPLFYSNIPLDLKCGYCQLTTAHLLREKRFNFKSVVFIDEASLVADSQLIKDGVINTQLLLFFKLFGHSTHGGKVIVNTQQLSDLHYALRRCTSQYFYVHHISRYIPFVTSAQIREERYSEDGSVQNMYSEDVENSLRTVLFRKSTFKKYDYCCFSVFTDDLPVDNQVIFKGKKESLKIDKIVSFRPEFRDLQKFIPIKESEGVIENEKENV